MLIDLSFLCRFARTAQLAYLVGLPPNEVPAVEIARGDLVEVVPASYGVLTRNFNFWSGEGRGDESGANLYENFAEATMGKGVVHPGGVQSRLLPSEATDMQEEAVAEEEVEKEQEEMRERESGRGKLREGGCHFFPLFSFFFSLLFLLFLLFLL